MARILVVDDSATHAEMLRATLSENGHDVDVASDGQQAIDHLNESHADLVVSDLDMPNINGLELTKSVMRRSPRTPVILVTAGGCESLAVDALAAGATNYVPKSGLAEWLPSVVEQSLGYRRTIDHFDTLTGALQQPEFYFKLPSRVSDVDPAIQYMIASLTAANCGDAPCRYRMATAACGAVYNAIRYGNLQIDDSQDCPDNVLHEQASEEKRNLLVRVKVSIAATDTRISVSHQGEGTLVRSVPAPGTPESFEVRQSRGMMLMTSFMDQVSFDRACKEVLMVKHHGET